MGVCVPDAVAPSDKEALIEGVPTFVPLIEGVSDLVSLIDGVLVSDSLIDGVLVSDALEEEDSVGVIVGDGVLDLDILVFVCEGVIEDVRVYVGVIEEVRLYVGVMEGDGEFELLHLGSPEQEKLPGSS